MIYGPVKKIMLTGINKYSKLFGQEAEKVQIKVTINQEAGALDFVMCNEFKPQNQVTFLEIMDKRFDFLGYEALSTPYLAKCIAMFCEEYDCPIEEASCFILKKNENVMLAFYQGHSFKKGLSLQKQLELLGIG